MLRIRIKIAAYGLPLQISMALEEDCCSKSVTVSAINVFMFVKCYVRLLKHLTHHDGPLPTFFFFFK